MASSRARSRTALAVAVVVSSFAAILGVPWLVAGADPVSPLAVTMTASPSPVASGAELTYTVTTVNTGGSKVTNVVLSDQLNGVGTIQNPPAAPQYVLTSSKGSCTQSAQLVSCSAGTLAGGESWTVTIRGVVTAPDGSTLNNTASVTGTRSSQNFTTTTSAQTLVDGGGGGSPLPDLTINKTGPTSVAAGATFAYTLTVNNIGTANAVDVVVSDTLPAGVELLSVSPTSLFTCTPAAAAPPGPTTVTCTGGAVNQGQNATITLNVRAPASGSLTNTAMVDPENAIAESNELNNSSATVNTSVTAEPAPAQLTIDKTDDPAVIAGAGPDPVVPMGLLTYKIRVTNTGNRFVNDVTVVDGTQGLEAASITATQLIVNGTVGNGNGCVVNAPEVRCKIRRLDAGGTMTVTITGTVIAPAGTTIFNTATATGNVSNVGISATDTETTTVRPAVDLTVVKYDDPDPVCARSWPSTEPGVCVGGLKYTFVVGNSGIQAATGVTVRDVLPPGVIYDSYTNALGSDFSCPAEALGANNVLTCTNASIAPESTESFSIIVVAPPNVGTITNTVTVDPFNTIFEADETNNTFSITTQVGTGIDLTVFKHDEPIDAGDLAGTDTADPQGVIPKYPTPTVGVDPIATSGTQYYTVYVDNLGTQDASGIVVKDTLPAGTKYLGATANQGFTCTHDGSPTGGVVTCIGGHLLGTASEFYDPLGPAIPAGNEFATIVIRAFATPNVQPLMHNEVRVDPDGLIDEVNELNNFAFEDTVVATGGASMNAFNQLTIDKTQVSPVPPAAVATNGRLTYDIAIGNDATDPVSNVVVVDHLPTGSRFVSASDTVPGTDAFFCTHDGAATGGTVTCTGGDLSGTVNSIPGVPTSRHIRIVVFAPNEPGSYANTATVDPANLVPEGNEFDNDDQVLTTVTTAGNGGQNSVYQLGITKDDSPPIVATSSVLTYTLTVTNTGTDPAFGVAVRDNLPAGTQFISAADGNPGSNAFSCSYAAGVVTCTGATIDGTANLLPGVLDSRTIVIKVFSPTQPGTITNHAFVDPDNTIPEGDETDNHDQEDTTVVVGAGYIDLQVRKCDEAITATCATDAPKGFKSGATITYRVEVTNAGTDPAFQVVVQDTLPTGMTFVSATDATASPGDFLCTHDGAATGGVVTCTGGTLDGSLDLIPAPNDVPTTRTIEITVTAPQVQSQLFTNQAFVDPANAIPESNEVNNHASDTSLVTSPYNLRLDKEGPTTAQQNNVEDYVITVTNLGDAVDDVVVVDALPIGLIPLSTEATPSNFICNLTENPVNSVTCIGDMGAAGAADGTDVVTITIHVFVTADGGVLDNEACVDPANAVIESLEGDNCDTKTTEVRKLSPNLSVQKSVSDGTVAVGQDITYTVTVSNVGDAPTATGWTLEDTLPAEVSFTSAVGSNGFTCVHDGAATGGVVTCTPPGTFGVGASTTITIQVHVEDTAVTPFTNTAAISGTVAFDASTSPCDVADKCEDETVANQGNNSDDVTVSVGGAAIDLMMGDITDNFDPVNAGQTLIYTFSVTNGGVQNALAVDGNQVVIKAIIPTNGVTFQSGTASQGFACVKDGSTLQCTGDLDAGEVTTVTIVFSVDALTPPKLSMEARVDAANLIQETDETNNFASEDTTVTGTACNGCIELVAGPVFANPNPGVDGGQVTYSFTVTNIGDQSTETNAGADDVVIGIDFDTTFNESDFASATPPSGWTCTEDVADLIPVFEVTCTTTAGIGPGSGVVFTIVANVNTASTPSYVDFDVVVDPSDVIEELSNANNDSDLRIDVVAQ